MHLFGPTNEEHEEHPPSSTTATPFTFTFTRIQTSDSEAVPFLKIPAELRNKIYELAAKDHKRLRLFDGQIVLPPLGSVCKKIRTEIRGIFEQEVISNTALDIEALVVNFDFRPLFNWLDEHHQRSPSTQTRRVPRFLRINVTCRPELSLSSWFDESSPRCSTLGDSLKNQRVQHLLIQNLMTTMTGWSWELTKFLTGYDRTFPVSPHRITQFPFFHAEPRCRRIKSGQHYWVAIIADDTWRYLDDTPSTTPQVTVQQSKRPDSSIAKFYTKIYDALVCDDSMRTDGDRKLALALREACQSRCTRAERDAVAVFTDLSHLRIGIKPSATALPSLTLSWKLHWKWACIIFERAAKELSRLEADLRVEKQKRHELLMAKKAEKAAKDARDRVLIMFNRAAEKSVILRAMRAKIEVENEKDQHGMAKKADKRLQTEDSRLALQQRASRSGPGSGSEEGQFEELTRMMARWHL